MYMQNKFYICLLLFMQLVLAGCYNKTGRENITKQYTEREIDSLSFYGSHHYSNNYNFLVTADSLLMLSQQPEETMSELPTDTFAVYKNDLLVVADIRVISDDAIDSVWVQVAKDQETFGWIHEIELLDGVVPNDPISRFIKTFSDI